MLIERTRELRAKRYRMEAAYLRGVIKTVPDHEEQRALTAIAEGYERLVGQLECEESTNVSAG